MKIYPLKISVFKAKAKAVTDGIHRELSKAFLCKEAQRQDEEINSQIVKELKYQILLGIVDKFQMSQCMIFCRTNLDCDNLERFLCGLGEAAGKFSGKRETGKENPYSCCVLAGMRSMEERRANLEAFKEGDVRFLICTDVAARGIDIKGLPFMINFTLPDEPVIAISIGRICLHP